MDHRPAVVVSRRRYGTWLSSEPCSGACDLPSGHLLVGDRLRCERCRRRWTVVHAVFGPTSSYLESASLTVVGPGLASRARPPIVSRRIGSAEMEVATTSATWRLISTRADPTRRLRVRYGRLWAWWHNSPRGPESVLLAVYLALMVTIVVVNAVVVSF